MAPSTKTCARRPGAATPSKSPAIDSVSAANAAASSASSAQIATPSPAVECGRFSTIG